MDDSLPDRVRNIASYGCKNGYICDNSPGAYKRCSISMYRGDDSVNKHYDSGYLEQQCASSGNSDRHGHCNRSNRRDNEHNLFHRMWGGSREDSDGNSRATSYI